MTIRKTNYDSILWKTLEKGRLADLSQYHASAIFEEVPLYSRLSDISFLADLRTDEANQILLDFSLTFLNSVIAYEVHRAPYLAAISVWNSPTTIRSFRICLCGPARHDACKMNCHLDR